MTYLLLQTFLLLLASYFLGAFLACLTKQALYASRSSALVAATGAGTSQSATLAPAPVVPAPVQRPEPVQVAVPRAIEPVQPKIDILARPEPKAPPKPIDTSRFERALMGPDPNEGMPRKMIVELRPAVHKLVTGPAQPLPVKPASIAPETAPPKSAAQSAPMPQPAPVLPNAAAAAAAAVAAAKAAAAAAAAAAAKPVPVANPQPKPAVAPAPAPAAPVQKTPVQQTPVAAAPAPSPAAVQPAQPPKPVVTDAKPAQAPPAPTPPSPSSPPTAGGDDLQRIRAIDPGTETRLKGVGIRRFEDIASWSPADINRVNQALGLDGRIDREQWIEQAQILAKGGETYYSRNRLAALKGASASAAATLAPEQVRPGTPPQPAGLTPVPGASTAQPSGKSVTEMAAAAAAAIAAASASVTRGVRPIEPVSPLSKVDPNVVIPAKLTDAIRSREPQAAPSGPASPQRAVDNPKNTAAVNDLKRIRGIGVLIEKRLNAMGIATYDQIAHWTRGDIDRVDQALELRGRVEREKWVEQARILSTGGWTEFSRRVDKGEVESSQGDD